MTNGKHTEANGIIMEGLSIAANGIAIVSVAVQLTEACIKLYKFWESVEHSPQEVAAIRDDLQYLISIFREIESNNNPAGDCIVEGIRRCRIKVIDLTAIVEKCEAGFKSTSWRKRKWTAFQAAIHSGHVQRFRDSLTETKSTLTLALLHQSFVQSRSLKHTILTGTTVLERLQHHTCVPGANQITISNERVKDEFADQHERNTSPTHVEQHSLKLLSEAAYEATSNALTSFERSFPQKTLATHQMNELWLHAIGQTAIAAFESESLEIFAQDTYMVDNSGAIRSRTLVYSENLRSRVRHRVLSFRTVFGCVRICTTMICLPDDAGDAQEKSQCVTSFAFYPAGWIQQIGIQHGLEVIIASVARSWVFNCKLTVTRAVPEDSLIFELCRSGQTRAVEALFSRGLASIVDTSPKGWKPLHFAAAGGHVDLCAMLVEAGADKTALVYEGPSSSIRSPISIFVTCASNLHTETRISMLRLFSDCIDISDSSGDGWTVHEWLKRTFARERVPVSQNSITWLLHATAKEQYVELTPRIAWSGLQHAIRSVLCHEQHGRLLERILDLSDTEHEAISQQQMDSISSLLALRVSGRVLLPMALTAGSFLQIRGFDWVQDHMTHTQYMQALPSIYAAWCHAVLECVENLKSYMQLELEECLQELGWNRNRFLDAISNTDAAAGSSEERLLDSVCTQCGDDYRSFPDGLISPSWIAVSECLRTGHTFDCVCQKAYESDPSTMHAEPQEYTGVYLSDTDAEKSDADETFYDAEPCAFGDSVLASRDRSYLFSGIATLLYRAQGRAWMGEHAVSEHLCATCFLHQENYIDEDGYIADFPPVPEHFNQRRF